MIYNFQSCLPILLSNRSNFSVQSYSGSGKGVTIAILMLSYVDETIKHPHILCVVPTMEAAVQLKETVLALMGCRKPYEVHLAVAGEKG